MLDKQGEHFDSYMYFYFTILHYTERHEITSLSMLKTLYETENLPLQSNNKIKEYHLETKLHDTLADFFFKCI